jgi:SAM-dependent methyltransferase
MAAHAPDERPSDGTERDPACCSGPDLNARIATFFDRRTDFLRGKQGAFPPLSPVSISLLNALAPEAEGGPTVLEFGSGTGGLAVRLLTAGASHATGVDLSATSVATARDRLAAAGFTDTRATFMVGDAADVVVEPHDWVILDRAICCYPDVDRLMDHAITSARTRIAYSVPESDGWRRIVHRAMWWAEDSWQTLRGFRPSPGYWHAIRHIESQLAAAGFRPTRQWRFRLWRLAIFERAAPEPWNSRKPAGSARLLPRRPT